MSNGASQKPDHLLWAIGGVLFGAWWAKAQEDDFKKSRAERDDPAGTEEVCAEIFDILDEWEPDKDCVTEDDHTYHLADFLDRESEWEIEVMPNVAGTKPDILIGDLLALELKLNPSKAEMDRCVGQCAGYSREWVTWIILVDMSASKVGWLEKLLCDKGLERIMVWGF
jgi:hypothetical protein